MRTDPHWNLIGRSPHHGICVALSSLRTKKSCGIGEFHDLIPLIDWCKSLRLDCIQLLPLNDTGEDPSPYNALSSCALDPLYLSLADLPDAPPHTVEEFLSLTQLSRCAKSETKHQKIKWLYAYFQKQFPAVSKTAAYQSFLAEHPWLSAYTLFKAFKDEYGQKSWLDWPLPYQTPNPLEFEKRRGSIDFHSFLQYLCFQQMEQVKAYASQRNIFLKGDIPILLSPDSADVWANRTLFHLGLAAGAPPDYYNPQGQRWGFPLFNWDEMRHTHFAWWRQRLKVAEKLFHLYRIDHVVGFFRIWGIPNGKKPTEGHFVPEDTRLWAFQGRELLEMMIDSTSLLPIAEDLGTIPNEVAPILKELGVCGTKVLRWQRRWNADKSYIPYSEYEPYSLTTLSTADSDILPCWWKKYPEEAIPFAHFKHWNYQPVITPEQTLEILRDAHHTPSYFHINLLQEYLALFPDLSWPNLEDERINIPGTLLPTNWTHRFRLPLEEIMSHQGLADAFQKILNN